MKPTYSISLAAQLSGLTTHVIRAWERRYGVVTPHRSDGNQRLYTDMDVERLRLLSDAVSTGHKIGAIATLAQDDLRALLGKREDLLKGQEAVAAALPAGYIERGFQAIYALEAEELDDIIARATISLGMVEAIDEVIFPLMERVGRGWHEGEVRVMHEHLASAVIRTFLGGIFKSIEIPKSSPAAVVATPPGQEHDVGALACAIGAAAAGYQVTFLGNHVPAEEMLRAVEVSKARVLVISIVFPGNAGKVREALNSLQKYLPDEVQLVAGGISAPSYLVGNARAIEGPRTVGGLKSLLIDFRE